jgi:hypothetical protein
MENGKGIIFKPEWHEDFDKMFLLEIESEKERTSPVDKKVQT